MGWIGPMHQLLYVLDLAGADKDEHGNVLITGREVTTFLGMGDEALVPDETFFLVNGKEVNLAAAMAQTSYGVKVNVI